MPTPEKIRARESYKMFARMLKAIRAGELAALRQLDNELDARRAYGSATNAQYASEALDQLLTDEGLKNGGTNQ